MNGQLNIYADVTAVYKQFEVIAKDCVMNGKITKDNETEIFLEALHPDSVRRLDQQVEQKVMMKRWAENMRLLQPTKIRDDDDDTESDVFKLQCILQNLMNTALWRRL